MMEEDETGKNMQEALNKRGEGGQPANKNALKHGADAYKAHGEKALDQSGRTRLVELREQVGSREGVLSVMQQKAADAVLLFELVQSYVAGEVKAGIPLGEIPALARLPAFMNSMQRALTTLISLMPKDDDTIDMDELLRPYRQAADDD
jgi:hypothetical protein